MQRFIRGFLFTILSSALIWTLAARGAEGEEVAPFDHQLELFTQLAMEGRAAQAAVFLSEPAFVHSADREGHTALFAAAVAGNLEILDRVLALQPSLNQRDVSGRTPLHYAACHGRTDVLRRLVQHGAQLDVQDRAGRTPLMAAVLMNHRDAASLLLDAGAAVNLQDGDGATALLYAADSGRLDLATLLLGRGANPRLSRNNGTTPLETAEAKSFPKVVDLLRKAGGTLF